MSTESSRVRFGTRSWAYEGWAGKDWSTNRPIYKASPVFVNTRAVNLYDDQRFLIRADRFTTRRTATGDDVMNPSVTAILKVTKSATAKTYRVWLVKYTQRMG